MRGIGATVAFIAGFLIFYQGCSIKSNVSTGQQTNSVQWETKTDDQTNVNVVVTPFDLSPQSAGWKFDIGINTHSVELDQDMTKSVTLIDDQGKEYKPLAWEGPTGGHHREGTFSFSPIKPAPKSFAQKITGIANYGQGFYMATKQIICNTSGLFGV